MEGHCNLAFHDTCQNYMSNLIKGNKYKENMKIHQKFINGFVRLVLKHEMGSHPRCPIRF